MDWEIDYSRAAQRQLRKLDRDTAQRIMNFMDTRVATLDNPRIRAEPLSGNWAGFWRYRVGRSHRVICDIQDDVLRVLVVRVARRDEVYR